MHKHGVITYLLLVMVILSGSCTYDAHKWEKHYQYGRQLFSSGKIDEAYTNATEAVRLSRKVINTNNSNYILSLSLLGDVSMKRKDYARAIECYKKVVKISIAEKKEYGKGYSISLSNLGTAYKANGGFDKAILCCEESVRISAGKYGENDSWTITSKYMLAQVYDAMGQSLNAIKMYEGVVNSKAVGTTDIGELGIAIASWRIGILFEGLGDYSKACVYYLYALKMMVKLERHEDVYALQRLLAKNYYGIKDYIKARKYTNEQIETATINKYDSKLLAESYIMKVIVEEKLKNYDAVIKVCEKCRLFLSKHENVTLGDLDINNLMACYDATLAVKGKSAANVYSELMNNMRNRSR